VILNLTMLKLEEVLKRKKFKLEINRRYRVVLIMHGQTQGCYRGYIDLKMKEKLGNYASEIEPSCPQ